jgi:hypothetical protein
MIHFFYQTRVSRPLLRFHWMKKPRSVIGRTLIAKIMMQNDLWMFKIRNPIKMLFIPCVEHIKSKHNSFYLPTKKPKSFPD